MLIETLKILFNRDLRQLKNEIINQTLDNFGENLLKTEYPTDKSGRQLQTIIQQTKK